MNSPTEIESRLAGALLAFLLATAAAHAQTQVLIPMSPDAYAEEPTSVPDYCSQLDVDCVLNDGPPHWIPHRASQGANPGAPLPATGATAETAPMNGVSGPTSPGSAGRR